MDISHKQINHLSLPLVIRMKALSKLSVVIAVSFLMLHTLLPHRHHSDLSSVEHIVEHESANSLMDYLKLALHLDQGKGHLENYKVVDGNQYFFLLIQTDLTSFIFQPNFEESDKLHFPFKNEALPNLHFISNLRFRGPPQA